MRQNETGERILDFIWAAMLIVAAAGAVFQCTYHPPSRIQMSTKSDMV